MPTPTGDLPRSETRIGGDVVTLGADDAGEILTLQRAAYVTEAILHDDPELPPLTQSLDELRDELADPAVTALEIRSAARLVGCVRLRVDGARAELGRLELG